MYLCRRTSPLTIDADLTKPAWARAERSPRFVDIITGQPGPFNTQSALLWDDQYLYVAFWIEEPYPQATLTQRDATIFREHDVEVFIDGADTYYEFEINALGTIYEVFFVWQDAYPRFAALPEFDVFRRQARTFGGNHDRVPEHFWQGTHPRGQRWAFLDWDFPGLQSAVAIQGRLNDPATVSQGWTVEIAFPWSGMTHLANGRAIPPTPGDVWRLMLARYQPMEISGQRVQGGWAWNQIGHSDNHVPELWTPIQFA